MWGNESKAFFELPFMAAKNTPREPLAAHLHRGQLTDPLIWLEAVWLAGEEAEYDDF